MGLHEGMGLGLSGFSLELLNLLGSSGGFPGEDDLVSLGRMGRIEFIMVVVRIGVIEFSSLLLALMPTLTYLGALLDHLGFLNSHFTMILQHSIIVF